jgi:TolB-like protein/tetratricopeptide (TPR) repeat protein
MDSSGKDDRPKRVFISYARADRPRLEPLGDALTARGYSVWWDVNIPGGATFAREIETALRQADAVVVAWSKESVASDWVRDEAALGRDLHRLAPITLDDTLPPLGFGQYQVVDFSKWNGEAQAREVARLVQAIDRLCDRAGSVEAPVDSRTTRATWRPISRRVLVIGGAVAVPVLAGGGWLAWRAAKSAPAAPPHSIAVLPFANLSGDPAQTYFSDGLSEELRGALVRVPALQVAARASSNAFRNAHQDVAAIAQKLGVAYVLDGSVRRSGDVVRVSVQLTDAASRFEKWSQTYDRPMRDVFAIQSEIASLVTAALEVKVLGSPSKDANLGGTTDAAAFVHFLRGRHIYDLSGDEATFRQALAEFDAAIAADPAYAAAQAARARALIAIGNQFASGKTMRALYSAGLTAAAKAVALAPDLAASQSALGFARFTGSLDVRGAAAPYERARALGEGDADILSGFGAYATSDGKFGQAMAALNRAAVLDPLNPRVDRILGASLYSARRYDEAIAKSRAALALNPTVGFAHYMIGNCLLLSGKAADARADYLLEPVEVNRLAGVAIASKTLGDKAAAQAAFARLTALGDNALYQRAEVQSRWGLSEAALNTLDQAYAAGDSGLTYLRNDPMLDALRGEPRFTRLLERIGFA